MSKREALSGRNRGFWGGRWYSFRAAVTGALHTVRTQPNAWIELTACVVVVAAGYLLQITAVEWAVVGLVLCLVLALEAINTAVEAVVDLVTEEYHPLARIAKDTAAGALVFAVLGSLIVAAAVFGPRLVRLLGG